MPDTPEYDRPEDDDEAVPLWEDDDDEEFDSDLDDEDDEDSDLEDDDDEGDTRVWYDPDHADD